MLAMNLFVPKKSSPGLNLGSWLRDVEVETQAGTVGLKPAAVKRQKLSNKSTT